MSKIVQKNQKKPRLIEGEWWLTADDREVQITKNLPNGFIKIINPLGMLEVISKSELKERCL